MKSTWCKTLRVVLQIITRPQIRSLRVTWRSVSSRELSVNIRLSRRLLWTGNCLVVTISTNRSLKKWWSLGDSKQIAVRSRNCTIGWTEIKTVRSLSKTWDRALVWMCHQWSRSISDRTFVEARTSRASIQAVGRILCITIDPLIVRFTKKWWKTQQSTSLTLYHKRWSHKSGICSHQRSSRRTTKSL